MDEALERTPYYDCAAEASKRQLNNLRRRNQLFRGAEVPAANFRHADGSPRLFELYTEDPEHSPPDAREGRAQVPIPFRSTSGILQEIRNSSMRRRRKPSSGLKMSPSGSGHGNANDSSENANEHLHSVKNSPQSPELHTLEESATSQLMPKNRPPPRSEYRKAPRVRARAVGSRRTSSGDASRYIEYLESSLVAAQTQLKSVTSPSNRRREAAKMRTMVAENRFLRHEVAQWEERFDERIKDHAEQYEVAAGGLRAQIKALQRENETVKAELDARSGSLDDTVNVNYDLDRRLELMSELLAASPTKIDLHIEAPEALKAQRQQTAQRRSIGAEPVGSISLSPDRRRSLMRGPTPRSIPVEACPPPSPAPDGCDESSFDNLRSPRNSLSSSTDLMSEASESTLIEGPETSPTRRRSWIRPHFGQPDGAQQRPGRKMRRFYTGSMGPRSLILPTAASDELPSSAPVTGMPTPSVPQSALSEISHPRLISPWLADRDDAALRRSTTWDEEESVTSQSRRLKARRSLAPYDASLGYSAAAEDLESSHSAQSKASRTDSLGRIKGRNLFEELSRIKQERDSSDDASVGQRPGTAVKHLDCMCQAPSSPSEAGTSRQVDTPSPPECRESPTTHPSTPHSEPECPTAPHSTRFFLPNLDPTWRIALPYLPPTFPLRQLLDSLTDTAETYSDSARNIISATWSRLILSQLVLEFRLWLIHLLVGRLRGKGFFALGSPSRSLGIAVAGSPSHGSSLALKPARGASANVQTGDGKRKRERRSPLPPPVTWLRFSMTMVCAVGIAIRDGPGSLFASFDEGERVDDGFAVVETAGGEVLCHPSFAEGPDSELAYG